MALYNLRLCNLCQAKCNLSVSLCSVRYQAANTAVSFSGVGLNLNSNESNKMYHSVNVSTFLIAALELGNLFSARYR